MDQSVGAKRRGPAATAEEQKRRRLETKKAYRVRQRDQIAGLKDEVEQLKKLVDLLEIRILTLTERYNSERRSHRRMSVDHEDELVQLTNQLLAKFGERYRKERETIHRLANELAIARRAGIEPDDRERMEVVSGAEPDVENGDATSALVSGIRDLLDLIPSNNPLRTTIRGCLLAQLDYNRLSELFDDDIRTWQRAANASDLRISRPKVYLPGIDMELRITAFYTWLDSDGAPYASGRSYRVIPYRRNFFYRLYTKHCSDMGLTPISETRFRTELKTQRIHWSSNPKHCPHCYALDIENHKEEGARSTYNIERYQYHVELADNQRLQFSLALKRLLNNRDPRALLVVQDFSLFGVGDGGLQDLIVVVYSFDGSVEGQFSRKYFHVSPNTKSPNDIRFVDEAWFLLLRREPFLHATSIEIWSDGGPKHYKISTNMYLWSSVQAQRPSCAIKYDFFASYHGYSACDAVASHVKQAMKSRHLNHSSPVETIPEFHDILKSMPNSELIVIDAPNYARPSTNTIHTIKEMHSFKFDGRGKYRYRKQSSLDDNNWTFHIVETPDVGKLKCDDLLCNNPVK